jgi:cytoskeletal protein CcmA (bactofilin family)
LKFGLLANPLMPQKCSGWRAVATKSRKNKPLLARMRSDASLQQDPSVATLLTAERSSVISEGVQLNGDITTPGSLHINGRLNGNIQAQRVVIGREGSVVGNINAAVVTVSGYIDGAG